MKCEEVYDYARGLGYSGPEELKIVGVFLLGRGIYLSRSQEEYSVQLVEDKR